MKCLLLTQCSTLTVQFVKLIEMLHALLTYTSLWNKHFPWIVTKPSIADVFENANILTCDSAKAKAKGTCNFIKYVIFFFALKSMTQFQ